MKPPHYPEGEGDGPEVELQIGDRTIPAVDLNAVIRGIVRSLMARRGWSLTETARRLGLKQQTLHAYMEPDPTDRLRGWSVDSLTRLCASQQIDVVEFFRLHPRFRGGTLADPDEHRLESLLSPEQRRYLARTLETLADRDVLDRWIRSQADAILGPRHDQDDTAPPPANARKAAKAKARTGARGAATRKGRRKRPE